MKLSQLIQNKLYKALFLMFLVFLIGVFGFKIISPAYTWIESIFMTVITISTVGFSEVHPSDEAGKLFTIFLIITSISIYAYVVSVVSEYIAQGRFFNELKKKKMQQKINQLHNHIIVCGYGRNGRQAVELLKSYNKQCVVIDQNDKIIEELESNGIICMKGDATDDKVLLQANINLASHLITAMPGDSENLFVVLSARQLNPKLKIISRAAKETTINKLRMAGADNIIMPDKIGGSHMASLIVTPDLMEFVDKLSLEGKNSTNLEEVSVNALPKEFINKTLLDLDVRKKTGCLVIGFKNPQNEYVINPDVQTILEPNTHIIVLGKPEQIRKLHEVF